MENLSDCHLDQHRRIAGLSQRKQYWLLYSPDLLQPRLMCLSQQLSQQMYPAYRIGGGLLLEDHCNFLAMCYCHIFLLQNKKLLR